MYVRTTFIKVKHTKDEKECFLQCMIYGRPERTVKILCQIKAVQSFLKLPSGQIIRTKGLKYGKV